MTISSKSLRRERRIKGLKEFFSGSFWLVKTFLFILIAGLFASTIFWFPLFIINLFFTQNV